MEVANMYVGLISNWLSVIMAGIILLFFIVKLVKKIFTALSDRKLTSNEKSEIKESITELCGLLTMFQAAVAELTPKKLINPTTESPDTTDSTESK